MSGGLESLHNLLISPDVVIVGKPMPLYACAISRYVASDRENVPSQTSYKPTVQMETSILSSIGAIGGMGPAEKVA